MGTILFIILRLIGVINTPSIDWVLLCFLVSLDSVSITNMIGGKK